MRKSEKMNWTDVEDHYGKLVNNHGLSHKSLDWGSRKSQNLRFDILNGIADLKSSEILDVGCGLADFWDYLNTRNIDVKYTGIDLTQSMISHARERFPQLDLHHANILMDSTSVQYDYVFASGIFAIMSKNSDDEIKKIILKMYKMCRKGIAFNSLSTWADHKEVDENYLDPVNMLSFCKGLSSKAVIRHDYMPHDFTVYLYKSS